MTILYHLGGHVEVLSHQLVALDALSHIIVVKLVHILLNQVEVVVHVREEQVWNSWENFLVHTLDHPLASVQELSAVESPLTCNFAIIFVWRHFKWLNFIKNENLYFLKSIVEVFAQRVKGKLLKVIISTIVRLGQAFVVLIVEAEQHLLERFFWHHRFQFHLKLRKIHFLTIFTISLQPYKRRKLRKILVKGSHLLSLM